MNWMAQLIGLHPRFMFTPGGVGGGVIQVRGVTLVCVNIVRVNVVCVNIVCGSLKLYDPGEQTRCSYVSEGTACHVVGRNGPQGLYP